MPKRVIDFDAMWASDKLAACAAWAQAEYAWLYGLADASGCFELTNLRVIWGRVAAIRGNFTIERLEQVFAEFQDKGLLFVWEHDGKRYAHWTGSDVPGRLPAPSWRVRLEKFAPPVPRQQFAEYMARFARGRAAMAGAGFGGEAAREGSRGREDLESEISESREKRGPRCRAEESPCNGQRFARGERDEGCGSEKSDSGGERGLGGPGEGLGCDRQMVDERLLVNAGTKDCSFESSDWRQRRGAGEHFGNSRANRTGMASSAANAIVAADASAAPARQDGARARCEFAAGNGLKQRLEEAQGQDLDWNGNLKGNEDGKRGEERNLKRGGAGDARGNAGGANRERGIQRDDFSDLSSNAKSNSNALLGGNSRANSNTYSNSDPQVTSAYRERIDPEAARRSGYDGVRSAAPYAWRDRARERELAVERELRVGTGPVCLGPLRPEVLERIRKREEERAAARVAARAK